jgi:uncharacterized protein with PQ loop repeat
MNGKMKALCYSIMVLECVRQTERLEGTFSFSFPFFLFFFFSFFMYLFYRLNIHACIDVHILLYCTVVLEPLD